jgi:hypothetical protein
MTRALTLATGATLLFAGWLGGQHSGERDPFLQRDYPCQEDELLGFSDTDENRTRCWHIEVIEQSVMERLMRGEPVGVR